MVVLQIRNFTTELTNKISFPLYNFLSNSLSRFLSTLLFSAGASLKFTGAVIILLTCIKLLQVLFYPSTASHFLSSINFNNVRIEIRFENAPDKQMVLLLALMHACWLDNDCVRNICSSKIIFFINFRNKIKRIKK